VGVAYGSDLALAESLMLQAARSVPRVLDRPGPTVWMTGYGPSSVDFVIHCWIDDPEEGLGNVRSDVLKALWPLLREHGIEIPFAQRDLNLRDSEGLRLLAEALKARGASD